MAARVTVDGAPEEHLLPLPVLEDELLVLEEVVQAVGIEGVSPFELLSQTMASDVTAALLLFGEEERDLLGVPCEASASVVLNDLPAVGNKGRAVEVDDVLPLNDFSDAPNCWKQTLE